MTPVSNWYGHSRQAIALLATYDTEVQMGSATLCIETYPVGFPRRGNRSCIQMGMNVWRPLLDCVEKLCYVQVIKFTPN
ncbi:hypothetical protein [Geitlerinema sp. PCC 9228]|jgi:hypothetical protein|uniref:hypothetical protein n=1 Tax=Geitlerinema sp. PCC 9228 TaxID=111611 RepID=UPI001114862A|nr:hypothetical protein [Geitlerinema sp. PCC 9228]